MALKVDHLRVCYRTLRGDVNAVDDVSFEIGDGEIMGLAGESGCGKSTLGNSLVRMDVRMRVVGGGAELDGQKMPLSDDKAMREFRFKQVSIVPQYAMSALNPTRRVGRMVSELLKSRGFDYKATLPELERRVKLVGLDADVLTRFPIELSGGMKQRTVMVISTLLNPSLLIADEVTSALDVSTQRAVGEMLLEFRDRQFVKSMMVITHDLSILAQVADTILVMYAASSPKRRAPRWSSAAHCTRTRSCSSPRSQRSGCATTSTRSSASRAGPPRSSTLRPVAGSATGARSLSIVVSRNRHLWR